MNKYSKFIANGAISLLLGIGGYTATVPKAEAHTAEAWEEMETNMKYLRSNRQWLGHLWNPIKQELRIKYREGNLNAVWAFGMYQDHLVPDLGMSEDSIVNALEDIPVYENIINNKEFHLEGPIEFYIGEIFKDSFMEALENVHRYEYFLNGSGYSRDGFYDIYRTEVTKDYLNLIAIRDMTDHYLNQDTVQKRISDEGLEGVLVDYVYGHENLHLPSNLGDFRTFIIVQYLLDFFDEKYRDASEGRFKSPWINEDACKVDCIQHRN